jgi:phage terminase large subunit-like protein
MNSLSPITICFPIDGKAAPLLSYAYLKAELAEGDFQFSCQYLCNPRHSKDITPFTDFLIDAHTIASEGLPQAGTYTTIAVWDCASSDNKGSDYSVGGVAFFSIAGPLVGRMFIVDIVRGKFSRYELPHQIAKLAAKWRVSRIGIEKSPGADYMENDIMRELVVCGYPDCSVPEWFAVDNKKDAKGLRIEGLAALLEQDRMYFLNEIPASVMEVVKRELIMFKRQSRRKDDTADMLAMLARYMPTNIELPKNEQERTSRAEAWLKDKFKHDMIYDPEFVKALPGVLQKPVPEKAFETPKELDGYPVVTSDEMVGYQT